MMNFKIGQMNIKVSKQEWIVITVPIGEQMLAIKAELFRMTEHSSVSVNVEIYNRDDITVVGKILRWMEE